MHHRTTPNAEDLGRAKSVLSDHLERDFSEFHGETLPSTTWSMAQLELKRRLQKSNVMRFLRWPIVERTMSVPPSSKWISHELSELQSMNSWGTVWKPALQESRLGAPRRYRALPHSSANLLHHAFHLVNFELSTSFSAVGFDTIVEFGGGYGSMCRLFNQLGFSGRYIIVDLPPVLALQDFYLTGLGIRNTTHRRHSMTVDLISSSESSLEAIRTTGRTLIVATWSLSEASSQVRSSFLPLVYRSAGMLTAYQDTFDSEDNQLFFDHIATTVPWLQRITYPIRHLPNNNYFFATR